MLNSEIQLAVLFQGDAGVQQLIWIVTGNSGSSMQRLILVCALVVGLAACGPTPRQEQPELSELFERAPRGPLPDGVRPVAYDIDLRIDPRRTRFGGTVTIDVEFDQPAQGFWLHGQGLEIREVTVSGTNMQDEAATWRDVLNSGVAWIHFPRRAGAGTVRVEIDYTAPFDANLAGLFKVEEQGGAYALAKSESIQARRFMPGFDEPRFKTPYDIVLTVPEDDIAISNTPIEREEILEEEGFKRITFKPTRPLPTYLLSLAVGPFDRLDGPSLSPNEVRDFSVPLLVGESIALVIPYPLSR
ncbi:hypothetical protein [Henriciella sp.]|uniref:hypothetical protein n=1 Tax=Henriciella sp. TaxID=1968823 RepID=UPI0025BB19DA|nr:hypothetical protein [Henriciella sp.]